MLRFLRGLQGNVLIFLILGVIAFFIVSFFVIGLPINVNFTEAANMPVVGFFYGLIHGMLIIISFIASIFSDNYTIYAIYNNGIMYNFGFILGIYMIISG